MKTTHQFTRAATLAAALCLFTSGARAEETTILLEDFEKYAFNLAPPWTTLPGSWDSPRVGDDGSSTNQIVQGDHNSRLDGAMRPMPFTFSAEQASVLFQFEGRITTEGQPYGAAGIGSSALEFFNEDGSVSVFFFGLLYYNPGGGNPAPPACYLRDATGTVTQGDTLEAERWYEFRGVIDWTHVEQNDLRGKFTLYHRMRGAPNWQADSTIVDKPLRVADLELITKLALRVDKGGSYFWETGHLGQMDNIRYKAPTDDIVIGFETSEDYIDGEAPPAPWQRSPEIHPIQVVDHIKHGDAQSLAIHPFAKGQAIYPVSVPPGESATFSVWIRPGNETADHESLGAVMLREVDAASGSSERNVGVDFSKSLGNNGTLGETPLSLVCEAAGTRSGDFTPERWYQVHCAVSPTEITYHVWMTLLNGTANRAGWVVNTVPRREGHRIDQIVLQGADSSVVYFDTLIYAPPAVPVTLTVASAHGSPVPEVGTHSYAIGTTVTASVEDVTDGLSQLACTGWTGTGSVPASGTARQVDVPMHSDSTLTWNWESRHWLEVTVVGEGSLSHADGFVADGSQQLLVATPAPGWLFMGWSGDLSGMDESAMLAVNGPLAVTATFSDDADGDGLTNDQEAALGTDPWNRDTDGDGFDDKLEVDNGGSPTVSDRWRIDYIRANGSDFDLYPSDVVLDLDMGQLLFDVAGGQAMLRFQMMRSDDLTDWVEVGEPVLWQLPVEANKRFFRLRVAN